MEKVKFTDLGLKEETLAPLTAKGFEYPTPIQEQAIPIILKETRDVIGQASTGTGKTAAFSLPIIDGLSEERGSIKALIITPTRELTLQVCKEINELRGEKKLSVVPIYGGASIDKQIQQIKRGVDIVVGTPGRLIDFLKTKKLSFNEIEYLVLDEADEMLNSGFLEDIEMILSKTNPERRVLLFSATMPREIYKLAHDYMNDPITITVQKSEADKILTSQEFIEARESDKFEVLCRVIDMQDEFYGLIFCKTKRDTDQVAERLTQKGYASEAMHGDLSQSQRERVLDKFRKKQCHVLVVTDVASRGLDITGLTHVINYSLPQDPESFVHRVGRTGRAGKTGMAITIITPSEFGRLKYIQKISKLDIKKSEVPTVKDVIERKREKIRETILTALGGNIDDHYHDLAQTILAAHSPEAALAGVLKVAFEDTLETQYKEIKAPSRDFKARGDDRGGYRGNNSRGGGTYRGNNDRSGGGGYRGGERSGGYRGNNDRNERSAGGERSGGGERSRYAGSR